MTDAEPGAEYPGGGGDSSTGNQQSALLQVEVPQWPNEIVATGDAVVDNVMSKLNEIPDVPLTEHPEIYQRIHAELQVALNSESDQQTPLVSQGLGADEN